MLLDVPSGDEVLPDSPQRRTLRQLVGKQGVAKTVMLPSGTVIVDGHSIDALSEGMPIEAGQRIRVIEVRGNRVVVRPADGPAEQSERRRAEPADRVVGPRCAGRPVGLTPADPLARPIGLTWLCRPPDNRGAGSWRIMPPSNGRSLS